MIFLSSAYQNLLMKYILSAFLLIMSIGCFCQSKQYLYYFDKDLNSVNQSHAIFYGTGEYENGLMKLMLYNNKDRHLIMIEHFTDSTLQLNDGLFSSYYTNAVKESEGNYTSGKQDGLWQRWDSSGNIIDSSVYNNGEIVMKTSYNYFPEGKIQSIILDDLANHKFRVTNYNENGNIIKIDTAEDEDKVFTREEVKPSFRGGEQALDSFLTQQVNTSDMGNNEKATIVFIVSANGNYFRAHQS
jgi:hypothetical protein